MVSTGDTAPTFTATYRGSDHETFDLAEHLGEGPVVLAFFPGAFTSTCTTEMETFEDRLGEFEALGASVYGISVDTPFALQEFREEIGLSFGMISDTNRRLVEAFDVAMDFTSMGVEDVAKRAVFVVDGEGEVHYAWVAEDPGIEPDYDEIYDAVTEIAD